MHSEGDTITEENTSTSKTSLISHFNIKKKHTNSRHIFLTCYVKNFLCTRGLIAEAQPRRKETGVGRRKNNWKGHDPPKKNNNKQTNKQKNTTTTTTTTCRFLYSFFASLYFPSFYFPLSSAPSACSSSLHLPLPLLSDT